MNDHVMKTVALVQSQIRDLERELTEKKKMANSLCELAGEPQIYPSIEPTSEGSLAIRADEFYGKALATAVRKILEKRAQAGLGAATVSEIHDALVTGGFRFDAKSAANAKRSLRISLTKNSATFHKLPNGTYGLLEWYPNAKERELRPSVNSREWLDAEVENSDAENPALDRNLENMKALIGPLLPSKPR
jgi:hypothetical protein